MGRQTLWYWAFELLCITAIGVIPTIPTWNRALIALPVLGLVVAKVLEEYRTHVHECHRRVREQLKLLRELLPGAPHDIRCTYHVPVKWLVGKPRRLRQTFDYIPEGGGAKREFPISKGIIGMTYEDKEPKVENFRTDEEYRRQMIARYHYTEDELKRRRADRRSYLCVPILDDTSHNVLGLLYFDSSKPDTFNLRQTDMKWRMIRRAAGIIRSHLT